jgi:glycosyltransferase involved in cell wall biosynthesis
MAQNASVSIVTVSQYARRYCLTNLSDLINAQIYPNIIEWVIVEGSQDAADALANEKYILALTERSTIANIMYVPFKAGRQLSDLRNVGNQSCSGDIIVCLDDDDYYPPTRVSHAVYRLTNSEKLLAGCSQSYIYFYATGEFFQSKSYGKGHSTNNCLAYKRAYLDSHQHSPGLVKAEESSFTHGFTEPMEQLDPMKTIVISGHGHNTVDKSWLVTDEKMKKMFIGLTGTTVLEMIPLPMLMKMEKMLEEL